LNHDLISSLPARGFGQCNYTSNYIAWIKQVQWIGVIPQSAVRLIHPPLELENEIWMKTLIGYFCGILQDRLDACLRG
jgi:hypothetical protein